MHFFFSLAILLRSCLSAAVQFFTFTSRKDRTNGRGNPLKAGRQAGKQRDAPFSPAIDCHLTEPRLSEENSLLTNPPPPLPLPYFAQRTSAHIIYYLLFFHTFFFFFECPCEEGKDEICIGSPPPPPPPPKPFTPLSPFPFPVPTHTPPPPSPIPVFSTYNKKCHSRTMSCFLSFPLFPSLSPPLPSISLAFILFYLFFYVFFCHRLSSPSCTSQRNSKSSTRPFFLFGPSPPPCSRNLPSHTTLTHQLFLSLSFSFVEPTADVHLEPKKKQNKKDQVLFFQSPYLHLSPTPPTSHTPSPLSPLLNKRIIVIRVPCV